MDQLVERTRVADKIADEVLAETSGLNHWPSFVGVESYNVWHTSYRNAIGAFFIQGHCVAPFIATAMVNLWVCSSCCPMPAVSRCRKPERSAAKRRLEAVGSTALILIDAPSPAYPGGMLVVGKSLSKEEETSCVSTPPSIHFTAASTCMPERCTAASSTRAARSSCTVT